MSQIDEEFKQDEDWMQKKWRPAMGWMYMLVCTMDMVIFPVLWSILQAYTHGNVSSQWQPLTLQGAGLFHIAMGAVLGITAFGRTQEKLAGTSNNAQTNLSATPSVSTSVSAATIQTVPSALSKPILSTPVVLDSNDPATRNTRND